MALSKAALAAVRAITRMRPDIASTYDDQRKLEDATARLTVASPHCRIDDATATAPDGYRIALRVFTPLDIDFSLKRGLHVNEDYRGTILLFHGGGWANGDVSFYTDCCMRTALKLERRVVAVDYRRSPEYRFPTALEDCYAATRQLFAGQILSDINPEHIVLLGDSAGGNLAAGVSLLARERGDFRPRTQVLLYPLTYNDHSETTIFDSVRDNGDDFLLTRRNIVDYVDMYLRDEADYTDPHFAPLLAPSLADMPRTLLISAEYDPLRDEGETFAARLEADGSPVECYRLLDAVHGYFLYPSVLSLVRDTYRLIANFLDNAPLPETEKDSWLHLLGTV
ncbi:alpha/beta hydrolase [Adlercreutzia sp. ZJ141]|uniref:alpha/beta hydrolase n=1 Tax=Adlercreutzia sp. ZJ141 TaxID=2709406 RepID=UPI0013EC92A7|nr:alpha/beta hydrolase [Adlercreutzia sp. ZJ141]